jgi:D-arabinose 1-dehydrogenase-like Zn-dependent alcohol dehydrogenase
MRTDARKLFKVPEGLEEKYVGPLMCAGITTFEPLYHYLNGVDGKGKTIGVMGIGGLGHMAVQFAAKMGATVVALSRGTSKEKFSKELGATSLLDTTSESAMAGAAGTLDQIIITTAGGFVDVDKLTPLMKPNGNM